MRRTLVMLLAGGGGSRLNVLARPRAKPAVPFGGMYRIIDFALSNVMNSGIRRVAVLTQYKPLSLNSHIGGGEAWDLHGRTRGAKILPPRTGYAESDWYRGTADAIRQNFDYIDPLDPERLLVLSGDHVYSMNYEPMIAFHKEKKADLTIAMMHVPWEDVRHFGVAEVDGEYRVTGWAEKPAESKSNLASLGIYVFDTAWLRRVLIGSAFHDFGHEIIPAAVGRDRVFAYPFDGYWRDVGTIEAYWEANMDLLDPESGADLHRWRVRTNLELEGRIGDRPPSLIAGSADVRRAIVSPGCHVRGSVRRSVLSPGVVVEEGAEVVDSVVMHNTVVAAGARLRGTIVDKQARIGAGATIGFDDDPPPNRRSPDHLHTGLIVVGRGATVPPGVRVGGNTIVEPYTVETDFPGREVAPGSTVAPLAGRRPAGV